MKNQSRMKKTKLQTVLVAIVLFTQLSWIHATLQQELALLDFLRHRVPGNENILPLSEYPDGGKDGWEGVTLSTKSANGGLSEEILKLYRIFTNEQVTPTFTQYIEIERDNGTKCKYKLAQKIESGIQGKVYLGCSTVGLEKYVAIKQVPVENDKAKKASVKEANFHLSMNGLVDGVTTMIDCGWREKEGYFVLVFELLDVEVFNLLKFCEGRFSLANSITLIRQLLKIVEEIHSFGKIHGDVKVEDLLLRLPTASSPLQMRVANFGLAQEYSLDPLQRVTGMNFSKAGTPYTKSTFAHRGEAPHPRNDLLPIWYMLVIFVEGELPWHKLLLALENSKTDEEFDDNMEAILQMKEETSRELLVGNYPELQEFVDHIMNLQIQDNPNYKLLDDLLEVVMNQHVKNHNWKFDWEVKLNMLFRSPNLLQISKSAVGNSGESARLLFQPFYASLIKEIGKKGRPAVEVLHELDVAAKNHIQHIQQFPGTIVAEKVLPSDMHSLSLSSFKDLSEDAFEGVGVLFAGFGYSCTESNCQVAMILQSCTNVWNTFHNFKLPVPFQWGVWDTQKINNIGKLLQHPSSTVDKSRYEVTPLPIGSMPTYPFSLLENVRFVLQNVFAEVDRKEVAQMGFSLKTPVAGSGQKKELVLVHRRSFSVEDYASLEYIRHEYNFSWSVDETCVMVQEPPAEDIDEKNEFIFRTTIDKNNSVNWKLARKAAVKDFFKNLDSKRDMKNVRVQWKKIGESYKFAFIQDDFYKQFLTGVHPDTFKNGQNWLPKTRISDGDWSLRQLANTVASEMKVRLHEVHDEYRDGLMIISTTVEAIPNEHTKCICELMSTLRSETAQKVAEINPEILGSAAFGYAITGKYIYGAVVFEELTHTFLKLINQNRLNKVVPELSLSDKNKEWAQAATNAYKKAGLFSSSGKVLLRASASSINLTQGSDESGAEGDAKRNNALTSSGTKFPTLSGKREGSRGIRASISFSTLVVSKQGDNGGFKVDFPSTNEVSIEESIKSYWEKENLSSSALTSEEYKSISIAAFTGSQSTKIMYHLYK